jgi:DNA repair exonuclease SbcCD nuclease subunit
MLAEREAVDAVLLAGDIFDGAWRDFGTGLFFVSQMARLRERGIRVFLIGGNHDAESRITRALPLPANVYRFSSDAAERVADDTLGIAVHGRSYARRDVTDDLSASYPAPLPGYVNIGLLHTSAGRGGHENYAPCTVDALVAHGYDYWALGHVHGYEIVHREPWIVFPGNAQGRHIGETGAKGCVVVEILDGRIASVERRPLDVVRWERCRVDAAGALTPDDVVELAMAELAAAVEAADGRLLATRLIIAGRSAAHRALWDDPERWTAALRSAALDRFAGDVWIESVELATDVPIDLDELRERGDALGGLVRALREVAGDEVALKELAFEFDDLRRKVPDEVRRRYDVGRPETVLAALREAEALLIARLAGEPPA